MWNGAPRPSVARAAKLKDHQPTSPAVANHTLQAQTTLQSPAHPSMCLFVTVARIRSLATMSHSSSADMPRAHTCGLPTQTAVEQFGVRSRCLPDAFPTSILL